MKRNIQTAERILSEGQESFDEESLTSLLEDFDLSGDSEKGLQENEEAA